MYSINKDGAGAQQARAKHINSLNKGENI